MKLKKSFLFLLMLLPLASQGFNFDCFSWAKSEFVPVIKKGIAAINNDAQKLKNELIDTAAKYQVAQHFTDQAKKLGSSLGSFIKNHKALSIGIGMGIASTAIAGALAYEKSRDLTNKENLIKELNTLIPAVQDSHERFGTVTANTSLTQALKNNYSFSYINSRTQQAYKIVQEAYKKHDNFTSDDYIKAVRNLEHAVSNERAALSSWMPTFAGIGSVTLLAAIAQY